MAESLGDELCKSPSNFHFIRGASCTASAVLCRSILTEEVLLWVRREEGLRCFGVSRNPSVRLVELREQFAFRILDWC